MTAKRRSKVVLWWIIFGVLFLLGILVIPLIFWDIHEPFIFGWIPIWLFIYFVLNAIVWIAILVFVRTSWNLIEIE